MKLWLSQSDYKELTAKLHSIDTTLIRQNASLEEHMRRTELLEEAVKRLLADMSVVNRHINRAEGILKLMGALSVCIPVIYTLLKLITEFLR